MEELLRLVAKHENLPRPEGAADDVLDDLLFLTFDLETMVMGYVDALIARIDPGFTLEAEQAERLLNKVETIGPLNDGDSIIKEQVEHLLRSLILVRDHLSVM